MKRIISRALLIATLTSLFGTSLDYITGLETAFGLDTLFNLRGSRPPPKEIVIIAMDEVSQTRLGTWQDLTRWRGFHAKLLQVLKRQGAELIVFDLQFITNNPLHDPSFSQAMRDAGNVLVSECVQKLLHGDEDFFGREECSESYKEPAVKKLGGENQQLARQLSASRKIPPTSLLANASLDFAPFYLASDDTSTVREVWTYYDALA